MKRKTWNWFVGATLVVLFLTPGCGDKNATTVIDPGDGYQYTPEEQANQEQLDSDREAASQ